jgi:WD40 repeat protein
LTLRGHIQAVRTVQWLDRGLLVSMGRDKLFKVRLPADWRRRSPLAAVRLRVASVTQWWDLRNMRCLKTLNHSESMPTCFRQHQGRLVSGAFDGTIRVRDVYNDSGIGSSGSGGSATAGRVTNELHDHGTSRILSLACDETTLVSGSHDNRLLVHVYSRGDVGGA